MEAFNVFFATTVGFWSGYLYCGHRHRGRNQRVIVNNGSLKVTVWGDYTEADIARLRALVPPKAQQ